MSNILCLYYSRTGKTAALMEEISKELDGELVALTDGVNRSGFFGWLRSGMDAMARKIPPVQKPKTKRPLKDYDLVILGTPVWAGRCSAPMRSFLLQFGEDIKEVAYVVTRGGDLRCEEVFDQMDLYTKRPRKRAVSIRCNTVGATFWREEFLTGLREEKGDVNAR